MPIRPENKARYPKDWPAISKRIRRRARNRCECRGECGSQHYIRTLAAGKFGRCKARNGKPHPATGSIVVLTVAHLDHQPEHCADENLKAMCQRCHNRMDAPMRAAGKKSRARAQRASGDLFNRATPQDEHKHKED